MKKVMNVKTWAALTVLAGAALTSGVQSASAQAASGPSSTRFSVDLKDATLRDALELVFQAAGNPSHVIDPSASQVRIGSVSFKNQEWRDIVRSLANLNKFRFRRENNLWIVDPRAATGATRTFGMTTASNFQMRALPEIQNVKPQMDFSVETRSNSQIGGQGNQGGQGGIGGNNTLTKPVAVDSNNPWSVLTTDHIYAGVIALFFQGGTAIGTQAFIVPSAAYTEGLGGSIESRVGTPQLVFDTSVKNATSTIGGTTGTSGTGGTGGTGGTTTSR